MATKQAREQRTIPVGTKFTVLGLTYTVVNINACDSRSYLVRTPTGSLEWLNLGA